MTDEIASSFNKNIETVDYYRYYHKKWKATRYNRNLGSFERLQLAKKCDGAIRKYDISLWKRVQEECREMGETYHISKKYRFYTVRFFVFLFLVVFSLVAFVMFDSIIFATLLFIVISISIILAFFAVKEGIYLSQKAIGKSYEQKKLVQELISNGIDFFKKESIDPSEYPLKLKFNDYNGLKQIKEKRNLSMSKEYFFYLDLDTNAPKFIEDEISEEEMYKEALSSFIRTSIVIFLLLVVGVSLMIILRKYVVLR